MNLIKGKINFLNSDNELLFILCSYLFININDWIARFKEHWELESSVRMNLIIICTFALQMGLI